MAVDSGEEFTVEVRGAFDDVDDISAVFTAACDGHPLAPIAGPIVVRGAKPGDVVAIDLIELTPFGSGKSPILRDFGVLRREFPEPMALSPPVRDGRAWFGGRIPLPLNPNLGTISTMPPEGYKPSYAGAHMWTAPCLQDAAQGFDRIACSHMSGLLDAVARDRWPRWFPRPELRTRQR